MKGPLSHGYNHNVAESTAKGSRAFLHIWCRQVHFNTIIFFALRHIKDWHCLATDYFYKHVEI
jgi:hypothetical protein